MENVILTIFSIFDTSCNYIDICDYINKYELANTNFLYSDKVPSVKGIWSGNSNSKAVDISKYGNNRTFHNSPNVSWTKDAFNLGVEGEATGEDIPSTKNEYWTINIPETGVKGNCNNTITVTKEKV